MTDEKLMAALVREVADFEVRRILQEALAHYDAGTEEWQREFEAVDVHASPHQLANLNRVGILDPGHRSQRSKQWRLRDVTATRVALAAAGDGRPAFHLVEPEPVPSDLMDVVVGLDVEREIVLAAVTAERPAHVLLEGPPASAKSLILAELERLPGSVRCSGGLTTRAGLKGFLLDHPECRYLLYDEIDRGDGSDLAALYGVMADGRLSVMQHGRQVSEPRAIWVIASCNQAHRLPESLRSRFAWLRLRAYDAALFRRVVLTVLTQREQADEELAAEIAERLIPHTRDARQAVTICRICQGDRRRVEPLVRALFP